jgi:F0F1-type ATP synthase delta subunit
MKKLSANQYAKVLYEVTQRLQGESLNKAVAEFTLLVRKNQAWKRMSEIVEAFQKYARKQEGWVELQVTAAHELSEKMIEEITKQFGGKADMMVAEDKISLRNQNKLIIKF